MFRDSNGVYQAMIAKSVIQLVLGGCICLILMWIQLSGLADEDISCEVFDR